MAALRVSIVHTIVNRARSGWRGIHSIYSACKSALPYFLSPYSAKKEATEQYPDPVSSRTEDELPPKSRGVLFNDIQKCSGCGDCVGACPVTCITLESHPNPDHPMKRHVSVFDIDLSRCVFCGLCVEVCPTGSLKHTRAFELVTQNRKELILHFGKGVLE